MKTLNKTKKKGLLIIMLLVFLLASCVHYPTYEIHGITFEFQDVPVVSEEKVRKEVEKVANLFEPYLDDKYEPADGILMTVTKNRPGILLARENEKGEVEYYTQKLCGLTWPWRNSYVYHKEFIGKGSCGMYELRLHYMHFLFPAQSESKDIKWMKKEGIL